MATSARLKYGGYGARWIQSVTAPRASRSAKFPHRAAQDDSYAHALAERLARQQPPDQQCDPSYLDTGDRCRRRGSKTPARAAVVHQPKPPAAAGDPVAAQSRTGPAFRR